MDYEDQPLFGQNVPSTITTGGAEGEFNSMINTNTPVTFALPIDDFYLTRNHYQQQGAVMAHEGSVLPLESHSRRTQPNIMDLLIMITQNERLSPDILPYPGDVIDRAIGAIRSSKRAVQALSQLHQVRLDTCVNMSSVNNSNGDISTTNTTMIDFASLIEEDQIVQQTLTSSSQSSPDYQSSIIPYSSRFLNVSEKNGKGGLREGFVSTGDLINVTAANDGCSLSWGLGGVRFLGVGVAKNKKRTNDSDVDKADEAHLLIGVVSDSDMMLGKPVSSSMSFASTVDNRNVVGALSSIGAGITAEALLLPFQPHDVLRLESTRMEFVLSELLRVRLHKIQALCQRLYHYRSTNDDERYSAESSRLGPKEMTMVDKLCELYEEAMSQSPGFQAISHYHKENENHNGKYLLPGGFFSGHRVGPRDESLSTIPPMVAGNRDDVILPEPFLRKRVFVRVLEDLGNFEFGSAGSVNGVSKALYSGDVIMAPFCLFEDYLADHKVRLL